MFPKHSRCGRISGSFDLNFISLVPLTRSNFFYYNGSSSKTFGFFCKINRIHFFSTFMNTLCSNPCVGPFPRIKISFFLLSIFVDELISTPKIIRFLLTPLPNEKRPCLSNPNKQSEYSYLSISVFLVNLTAPNEQYCSVG